MAKNNFHHVRRVHTEYFRERGYALAQPTALDGSDNPHAFLRSLSTAPTFAYMKKGDLLFGSNKALIQQPVVRPEDFTPIHSKINGCDVLPIGRMRFRCGIFELMADWHTELGEDSVEDALRNTNRKSRRFHALAEKLIFFRDVLGLDPAQMGFTLWPGGDVGEAGYFPKDDAAYCFLTQIWGAKEHQIGWDPENIWPEFVRKEIQDRRGAILIAPRVEMYYFLSPQGTPRDYPITNLENAQRVYMELMTHLTIGWIFDSDAKNLAFYTARTCCGRDRFQH